MRSRGCIYIVHQNSSMSLMRLPRELRGMILNYIYPVEVEFTHQKCRVCSEPYDFTDTANDREPYGFGTDILNVNRQLYEEASTMMFKRTFKIHVSTTVPEYSFYHDSGQTWPLNFPFAKARRLECYIVISESLNSVAGLCDQLRLVSSIQSLRIEIVNNEYAEPWLFGCPIRDILCKFAGISDVQEVEIIIPEVFRENSKLEVQACLAAMTKSGLEQSMRTLQLHLDSA